MRYLLGGFLLILAAASWYSGLMRSQLELVMLGTIGLTGILLMLPPPRPRNAKGPLRSMLRLYLAVRGLMAVPIGGIGILALQNAYTVFSAGTAQAHMAQSLVILFTGLMCFSAGLWLLATTLRAW